MLDVFDDVLGTPGPLARQLTASLEFKMLEVVVEGFDRWKDGGFERFGEYETHFTARLVGEMRQVVREHNLPFMPQMEIIDFPPEVYAGVADPAHAPRIDISVWWDRLSEDSFYTLECKRLSSATLVANYVNEGLMRFITGKYARATSFGGMIGYAIDGNHGGMWKQINAEIDKCGRLKDKDYLAKRAPIRTLTTVYESCHSRLSGFPSIRITHLLFDVSNRPPLPHQALMPPATPASNKGIRGKRKANSPS